ncbi:ATP-binding protein [Streptomyces sp. MS06]|uniref:ATP-binding protein n=1 Tax=Streptomyces sp. MS06 TaxID=3385974 RepID=UPI0039A3BEF1
MTDGAADDVTAAEGGVGLARARHRAALERDAETAAARRALDDLLGQGLDSTQRMPRGGLLAFTGEPGTGKTTMLAEIRRLAGEGGCTVMSARGGEQEQSLAFHTVRQLLQPVLASCPPEERRELLGDWYGIVGPCVGLCPVQEGAGPDPQGAQDGLDWVVTHLAVQHGPLALFVDDAHWSDPESLSWLAAFAARIEELPVLLVLAYRADDLPPEMAAIDRLAGRQKLRPIPLAPLSPTAVSALVEDALGTTADDAFCREVWSVTGGNPFAAVELTATVREQGLSPVRENAARLRHLAATTAEHGVAERLNRMGNAAVRLAWAIAVLGTEATPNLAASVAALPSAEADDAVGLLRGERLLKVNGTLEFTHPLIGEAVYRAIPAAMRVALHGKAAWELVEAGRGPTAAARHLLETHPEGDPWVVEQLRQAAREYLRTAAPDAARRSLVRALREPPPDRLRATVLYELGRPAMLHDPAAAVNHLQAALAEPAQTPELHEGIIIRLARALAYGDRLSEALRLLEEEAARAPRSQVLLRLQAEQFMMAAFSSREQNDPARSRRLAQLAQRLTGRDATERYLYGLRAWDAMVRGEPAEVAVQFAEKALARGMNWTDEHWGFEVPALTALTFLHCDRPDRAEELCADGVAQFEAQGWRGAPLAFGYTCLAYIRFRRGLLPDAEDFARAGLRLAERVGPTAPVHWYAVGTLIEILLARGQARTAEELAGANRFCEPFPSAVTLPDARTVRGQLLLARGMAKEAADSLTEAGQRLDDSGMHNPGWCPWLPQLALACRGTDPQQAEELAQRAIKRAVRFGAASAVGRALHAAGRVAEGRESISRLRRAVSQLEESPAAYDLACARVDLGAALRRAGRPQEAAEHLYRGIEGAVACGADATAAQARDELAAAGLRPRRLGPDRVRDR